MKSYQKEFKKSERDFLISRLSKFLLCSVLCVSIKSHSIESYEHWGLGIAPIFSFATSSAFQQNTDPGLGTRLYFRKNMREWGVDIGVDYVDYTNSLIKTYSFFALGIYRFQYMDTLDFSVGLGYGARQIKGSGTQDELYGKARAMVEWELKPNQTMSIMIEYDRGFEKTYFNENLQDFKLLTGFTYYFGFYNLGQ